MEMTYLFSFCQVAGWKGMQTFHSSCNPHSCPVMLSPSATVYVKSSWCGLQWFTAENSGTSASPRDGLIYQRSKLSYYVTCRFWIGELFSSFSLSLAVKKHCVKFLTWCFPDFYCTKSVLFNSPIKYYWLCSEDEAAELPLEAQWREKCLLTHFVTLFFVVCIFLGFFTWEK